MLEKLPDSVIGLIVSFLSHYQDLLNLSAACSKLSNLVPQLIDTVEVHVASNSNVVRGLLQAVDLICQCFPHVRNLHILIPTFRQYSDQQKGTYRTYPGIIRLKLSSSDCELMFF